MIWDLPHPTHTRFLESLSPVPHLESTLNSRYIGFAESLLNSKKSLLRLIFTCSTDLSSQTGQNLAYLLLKYKKLSFKELTSDKNSSKTSRVYPIQREELWKINLLQEISLLRLNQLDVDFDPASLEEILDYICLE
jgi:hypothetical protein